MSDHEFTAVTEPITDVVYSDLSVMNFEVLSQRTPISQTESNGTLTELARNINL
jgi:hypothetical protein